MKHLNSLMLAISLATTAAVQATEGEFEKKCTMSLAMGKHIATDCSVNWVSDNGKVYCFADENVKKGFLKDVDANLSKAQIFWSGRLGP